MKRLALLLAVAALTLGSCKKDEAIEPDHDSRLYGQWSLEQMGFPDGNVHTNFNEDWIFTPDSISFPWDTVGYTANGSVLIIDQTDTLTYLISGQELSMIDAWGTNLVFARK